MDATPEWQQVADLFDVAQSLPPEEREAALNAADVSDVVRREVRSLLKHAQPAEDFFAALQQSVVEASMVSPPSAATVGDDDFEPLANLIGRTVAHYRITDEIGRGGMGVVYKATDERLQRTVALKVLHPRRRPGDAAGAEGVDGTDAADKAYEARAKAKLLAEARASAALDHPNICTVYDVGETDDHVPYIAMAYYAGETLEARLERGPLPVAVAAEFAAQIASGLSAAHARGIVHRDVKPANVLVTEEGVIKLLDFGIARDLTGLRHHSTHRGFTPGTVSYMSPEQVLGTPVDARSDLWSLGIVLYEMCVGRRPFLARNVGQMLYDIVYTTAPALRDARPDAPLRLQSIVARLLAKDRADRYENARDVAHELTRVAMDEAALAPTVPAEPAKPATASAPVAKPASSTFVVRALLASLAVVGVIMGALWWNNRASPARADTRSPSRIAAQDLYAQGHRDVLFRTESGRREALGYFRQAIAADSTFATAHAGLAHLLVLMSDNSGSARRAQLAEAEREARTAIALDSTDADAHAALGHVLLYDYRFAEAEAQFRRAIALDAGTPYVREFLVWLYIFTGDHDKALAEAQRGALDNPTSPTAVAEQARALMVIGRCAEAWPLLEKLLLLKPPPARVPSIAAQCHVQRGEWAEAVALMRPVAESSPLQGLPWLSFFLARSGDMAGARVVRDSLLNQWRAGTAGAYGVALAYAGMRDMDSTFVWLRRAVDDRSLRYNIMEPVFAEVRRDARFGGLLAGGGNR